MLDVVYVLMYVTGVDPNAQDTWVCFNFMV